jgi:voltage-gated potassium channel Kch
LITSIEEIVDGEVREYSKAATLTDINIPLSNQYLGAIYYMTTTLTGVGYGDILPTSIYEVILLSVAMVVGAGIFSYIVGNAEQFIIDFQGIDVELQDKMEEVIRLLFEVRKKVISPLMMDHLQAFLLLFPCRRILNNPFG